MKNVVAILGLFCLLIGCEETDILNETGKMEVTDFNLPNLPTNYYYEGWLLVDGSFVSVGNITNDSIANGRAYFENIEVTDLANAQSFAITVENSGSPAPSNIVLLLGNFDGNTAQLSPDAEASNGVLGIAKRITAAYTVQNATVAPENTDNYGVNGVWFFKGTGNEAETTLQLDYEGINYQAWLKNIQAGTTRHLNMGVIKSDTATDTWKNFTLFRENTPDFAGEDFLVDPEGGENYPEGFFPLDVRGSQIRLTPIPTNYDNTETPFPIFLWEATIPADAAKDPNLTRELHINTNFGAKATKL